MTRRYQPVWVSVDDDDGRCYSIMQVTVDDAGKLINWTQTEAMIPNGESIAGLTETLAKMLMDANLYKPVAFSALRAGMVLERMDR